MLNFKLKHRPKTLLIYSTRKGTLVLIKWLNSNTIPPKIAQIRNPIQYKSICPADFDMKLGHFNCEDLLYIYIFIPRFKYLKFIYQLFHLHLFLGVRLRTNLMTISQLGCQLNWLERFTGIAEVKGLTFGKPENFPGFFTHMQ